MRVLIVLLVATAACQSGALTGTKAAGPPPSDSPAQIIPSQNVTPVVQPTPAGADPQKLAVVQQQVSDDNANEAADVAAFSTNGWAFVTPQIPDLDVVGLNPQLIAAGRESDLRAQLASTTAKAADVANIAAIAAQTQNADVRLQAVRALSRIDAPAAQQALLTLATTFAPDDDARQHCLASLRPPSVSDALTAQIAALITDTHLSETEQTQIAFTIALLQARDAVAVVGLPDAAQLKVDAMSNLLRGGQ